MVRFARIEDAESAVKGLDGNLLLGKVVDAKLEASHVTGLTSFFPSFLSSSSSFSPT